jgi:hypothetical protein
MTVLTKARQQTLFRFTCNSVTCPSKKSLIPIMTSPSDPFGHSFLCVSLPRPPHPFLCGHPIIWWEAQIVKLLNTRPFYTTFPLPLTFKFLPIFVRFRAFIPCSVMYVPTFRRNVMSPLLGWPSSVQVYHHPPEPNSVTTKNGPVRSSESSKQTHYTAK